MAALNRKKSPVLKMVNDCQIKQQPRKIKKRQEIKNYLSAFIMPNYFWAALFFSKQSCSVRFRGSGCLIASRDRCYQSSVIQIHGANWTSST